MAIYDGEQAIVLTLIDQVSEMIMRNRVDLNLRDNQNRTALGYAKYYNSPEIYKILKEAGGIE